MEIQRTQEFDKRLRKLADARARARVAIAVQKIETRIHYGPGYRVYFVRRGEEIVVLLLCGDKAGQPADIVRAREMASQL